MRDPNPPRQFLANSHPHPVHGFQHTEFRSRSFLIHPMGFPLLIYLNDIPRHIDHPSYVWYALDGFMFDDGGGDPNDRTLRENLFAATALNWQDTSDERSFTKQLLFNIRHSPIGESLPTIDGNKKVVGSYYYGERHTCTIDFLFHKHFPHEDFPDEVGTDGQRSSIRAMLELGLDHAEWWKTHDHMLKCVSILQSTPQRYRIDQPVLLIVMTVNDDPIDIR
jgi:hypothetical protein